MRQRFNPMMIVMLALLATWAFRGMNNFDSPMDWVMQKVYILPGILVGLSFHEFAHAWVAKKLGDDTAERQGRVTINPAAHLDIVGFVSLLVLGFGWGIPVPVDERNFKHPRRDNILVSLAGVTMNLLIAVVFTVILKIIYMTMGYAETGMTGALWTVVLDVIVINLVLM
ncbi:MAG: site-2 protease family protein, partial [Firmicutes bacterium]|nr:site-2 protease family protein [Bacillota bacterium]